jgi:hypothetical protein
VKASFLFNAEGELDALACAEAEATFVIVFFQIKILGPLE